MRVLINNVNFKLMTVYYNENAHVPVCAHAVCLCITFALCLYVYVLPHISESGIICSV